jgi:hypothetical protein
MNDLIVIVVSNAAMFDFYLSTEETNPAVCLHHHLGVSIKNVYHVTHLDQIPNDVKQRASKKIVLMRWCWAPMQQGDLSWADLVVNLDDEIISESEDQHAQKVYNQLNTDKFITVTNSVNRNYSYSDKIYIFPAFLVRSKINNQILSTPQQEKPYLFDALLGLLRAHRQFVFYSLIKHQLLEKTLASFVNKKFHQDNINDDDYHCYISGPIRQEITDSVEYQRFVNDGYYYSTELVNLDLTCANQQRASNLNIFNSYVANSVDRHGYTTPISQLIPTGIYDASWYSIITETNYTDQLFFSEKTAKPLFAKRVFVMFSSQGMLAKLKEFGFKTFDNIIDESYDLEPDLIKRFQMAFDQVIKLSTLDPVQVYEQASDILEHNHQLMLSDIFTKNLSTFILESVKKAH